MGSENKPTLGEYTFDARAARRRNTLILCTANFDHVLYRTDAVDCKSIINDHYHYY